MTFLKDASMFGDLCVGIGSDYSIEKYKGEKPVCPEAERLFMLQSVRYVSECWINSGEGPEDFIVDLEKRCVDILVVNEDQHTEKKETMCQELGIRYIILDRYTLPGLPVRSTTEYRKCK
jgi:glycerol-3-phosphate cytidylyltransferase-like family protein